MPVFMPIKTELYHSTTEIVTLVRRRMADGILGPHVEIERVMLMANGQTRTKTDGYNYENLLSTLKGMVD